MFGEFPVFVKKQLDPQVRVNWGGRDWEMAIAGADIELVPVLEVPTIKGCQLSDVSKIFDY